MGGRRERNDVCREGEGNEVGEENSWEEKRESVSPRKMWAADFKFPGPARPSIWRNSHYHDFCFCFFIGDSIFEPYITAGPKVITSGNLGLSLARGLGSLNSTLLMCSAPGIKGIRT